MIKSKIFGIVIIFSFTLSLPLQAVNKIDSLKQLLHTDKEDTNKVIHLNNLCKKYIEISSHDTAKLFGNVAMQLAIKLKYPQGLATSYNYIGIIYYYQSDYEKALKYFLFSLKISTEIDYKKGIAASYNNIGLIYQAQAIYDKALENYSAALKIQKKIGNKKSIANCYNNIGIIYLKQRKYNMALKNYYIALKLQEVIGDKQGMASSYNNIGYVYEAESNNDMALKNYFFSLNLINEETGDKISIATTYINIGMVYKEKSNFVGAMGWFQKGLELSKKIGAKKLLQDVYQGLSDANAKMNDYKNAYQYLLLYSHVKADIFSEESNKQITEMQVKYETEKKSHRIKELEQNEIIKELSLDNQKKIQNILWGSSAVFFCLLVFLFVVFIKKQKLNRQLIISETSLREIDDSKNKMFSIVSHDMKNAFSILHSITNYFAESFYKIPEEEKYIIAKKLCESSNNTYHLVDNLLAWTKAHLTGIKIIFKKCSLNEYVNYCVNSLIVEANDRMITFKINIDKNIFVSADSNMLQIILRNLLSNAVKYSKEGGIIDVQSRKETEWDYAELSIRDYGIGMSASDLLKLFKLGENIALIGPSDKRGAGLGLILTKELIELNDGKITVNSVPRNGTEFIIILKTYN